MKPTYEELLELARQRGKKALANGYGSPTAAEQPSDGLVDKFRGRLPSGLVDIWEEHGLAGFNHGAFWLTDPRVYREAVAWWLSGTTAEGLDDFHVIARGPFGDLLVWAERTGVYFPIHVAQGLVGVAVEKLRAAEPTERDKLSSWATLLSGNQVLRKGEQLPRGDLARMDLADKQGRSLFDQCRQAHGPLAHRQVYGFAPYLFAGGNPDVSATGIVDEFVQLDLIQQSTTPLFKDLSSFPG